jgi:hemolysin activation/secretion protein
MKSWQYITLCCSLAFSPPALLAQERTEAAEAPEAQRGIQIAPTEDRGRTEPTDDRPEMDRTPVLPDSELLQPRGSLVAVERVYVREIHIENRTLVAREPVQTLMAPYIGREITFDELDRLRQELSVLYFDQGFVNSGVILPDQDISEGVITFREVRGRITEISLEGNRALRDRYWLDRLEAFQDDVLQINDLQSSLQLIEQEALVQRVEAQLLPGSRPGESSLSLNVTETRPWSVTLGFDNYRSPSLGGEQLTLYATHRSLTGRGDALDLYINAADGLGDGGLSYALPLGRHGTRVRGYGSMGNAEIVEQPFDLIDIDTEVEAWGIELSHPFYRTPEQSLIVFAGVESQHSESTLLDIPFSFSLGEIAGSATAVVAIAGAEWVRRGRGQVLAARMSLRRGLDAFGAEVASISPPGLDGPDTESTSVRGQLQYVRELDWLESELHIRGGFQFAFDPLLPVEKLPIGGVNTVRGYRENLFVRDNGLNASIEWRLPLFTDSQAEDSGFQPRRLTAALFTDFGQSWDQNTGLASDKKERVYSVGAGLIWQPLPGLDATVYYGEGLKDLPFEGDDLQDRGWHFRVGYQY